LFVFWPMGHLCGIRYAVEWKFSKRIFQPTLDYLAHTAKWKRLINLTRQSGVSHMH
jgi:hypothetical protein